MLIYPLMDKVMVGTTDLRIEDPDDSVCTEEEIDYMLQMVPKVFPKYEVSREDIVFMFAGVRPLPPSDANATGQITRDHTVKVTGPDRFGFPIYSLVGGKWTSYRAFSEEVTDRTLNVLNLTRKASTAELPIGGGKDYPTDPSAQAAWIKAQAARTDVSEERIATLFSRYGTRAALIAALDNTPLDALPAYSIGEIQHLAAHEHVVHIEDLLLRRSLIAWLGQVNLELVESLAEIIGDVLGWDADRKEVEIKHNVKVLFDLHGVSI